MKIVPIALGVVLAGSAAFAVSRVSDLSHQRMGELLRLNFYQPTSLADQVETLDTAQLPQDVSYREDINKLKIDTKPEALTPAQSQMEDRAKSWAFEGGISEYQEFTEDIRQLPDGLNIYIAETVNQRLRAEDILVLPKEVRLAIWPDNALAFTFKHEVYLINPPTDRMEYYYIQPVTQDESDFYFRAFENADGLFIRRGELIRENPAILELVAGAILQKEIKIVGNAEFGETLQTHDVEFVQITNNMSAAEIRSNWEGLVGRAEAGEALNIVMEASTDNLKLLSELLIVDRDTRFAALLEERERQKQLEKAKIEAAELARREADKKKRLKLLDEEN